MARAFLWYFRGLCVSTFRSLFPMPSGSASDGTWLSLLDEKKQHVRESFGPDYKFRRIGNRRAFRSALEKLCSREREYQPPQILTTIVSSVYPVAQFAKAIDESALQHLSSEEGLEGLIWDTSFALIEVSSPRVRVPVELKAVTVWMQ